MQHVGGKFMADFFFLTVVGLFVLVAKGQDYMDKERNHGKIELLRELF